MLSGATQITAPLVGRSPGKGLLRCAPGAYKDTSSRWLGAEGTLDWGPSRLRFHRLRFHHVRTFLSECVRFTQWVGKCEVPFCYKPI